MKPETRSLSTDELLDHTAWIRALARGLVHDKSAVEDLVQETWLAFLRRRPSEEESIRPWLARVLRNQAALRLRRLRNGEVREREVAPGSELPSALELVERAETQRRLVEAVLELDEPYRNTVLLRYFEGLSAVEIARRRAIPAATVRTHLKRGLDRLRERFDQDAGGDRRAWVGALLPLAGTRVARTARVEDVGRSLLSDVMRLASAALVAGAAAIVGVTLLLAPRDGDSSSVAASATAGARQAAGGTALGPGAPQTGARVPASRAPQPTGTVAPVSLRLVRAADGTPLADYRVELSGPQQVKLERTTDATGRIVLDKGAAPGDWSIVLVDHPGLLRRRIGVHSDRTPSEEPLAPRKLARALAAGETTIAVDAGPSYALDLELPRGVLATDLYGHVLASRDPTFRIDASSNQLAPVRAEASAGEEDGTEGTAAWVRFGPLSEHFTKQGLQGRLELFTQDGLYKGEADVPTIRGATTTPIAVTLEPRATLHGLVTDELGPAATLDVRLVREDGTLTESWNPDADGSYRIRWLEPGTYTVRVESPLHRAYEMTVELGEAEDFLLDLALERHVVAGRISGRLRSSSGRYAGSALVVLDPVDPSDGLQRDFAFIEWIDDAGELVAPFAFESVPVGEWDVSVLSLADNLPWSPSIVRVTAPAEDLELLCADQLPVLDWGVQVLDANTGKEVRDVTFVLRTPEGLERSYKRAEDGPDGPRWEVIAADIRWTTVDGPLPARDLPYDAQFEWAVVADGYAPAYGDQDDFASTAGGRMATAHVLPGWGARLRVTDLDGAPLGAASIELGGAAVAALHLGEFQLAGDGPPTALDVLAPGYVFAGGPYRPDSGELVGSHVWYEIRLRAK